GAGPGWYLVSIYADLEGGAQISAIAELDLLNLDTTGTPGNPEEFVGAWECAVPDIPSAALPEEVYRAFSKAVETGTPQAEYMPVVLLAEQVVAGMNYKILCRAAGDGRQYITVLTVYADLEGGAEITSEEALDLTAYTTPEPEG
ncbi:MAG: hypothetical protein IJM73_02805, partial [Spirochaetales bacterium]|nr:hypothetical protein [Spirochaetales bacterium]